MGMKQRERRVEVFFYGLFMDEELLHGQTYPSRATGNDCQFSLQLLGFRHQ
jgi:hypothetical protein